MLPPLLVINQVKVSRHECAILLPPDPLPPLYSSSVTTLVEVVRMVDDTPRERVHYLSTVLGNAVTTVKWQVAIVGSVCVTSGHAGSVEGSITVESLVAGQHPEHTARPVLARYVCNVNK